MFSLLTNEEQDITDKNAFKLVDDRRNLIEEINEDKWAEKNQVNKDFRTRIEKVAERIKKELDVDKISTAGDFIRNEILNASTFIMKYPEGVTNTVVEEIFSDSNLLKMQERIKNQADESAVRAGFYKSAVSASDINLDEESKASLDKDSSEEEIETDMSKFMMQQTGKSFY